MLVSMSCLFCHAESGGICAFCKNQISLAYNSKMPTSTQQRVDSFSGKENKDSCSASLVARRMESQLEEATTKAVEFKNRLVEFDKNSAVRTTVIDDQSDFFEVDSNVWLSPQVWLSRAVPLLHLGDRFQHCICFHSWVDCLQPKCL